MESAAKPRLREQVRTVMRITTGIHTELIAPLLERRERMLHAWQRQDSFYQAPVSLPFALRRKYPNAGRSLE